MVGGGGGGVESNQEGRLQASKERWGYREAEKEDCRQAKRDGKARRDGNLVAEESSQEGRLQASKERWKYK